MVPAAARRLPSWVMWRVSSSDGSRWVQWNGRGDVTSAPAGLAGDARSVLPVEIAAMTGDFYTPDGADDPTAVYLRARNLVGGRLTVTGTPPRVPAAGGHAVPGLRY